jgi:hypothetical protein
MNKNCPIAALGNFLVVIVFHASSFAVFWIVITG